MEETQEISLDKRYQFPTGLKTVLCDGKILIISPETANWVVLNSDKELEIFHELSSKPLGEVLLNHGQKHVERVLVELEAKQFEKKALHTQGTEHGLCLYLTTSCNMRCKHCYMYAGTALGSELSTAEIKKLLYDFAKHHGVKLTITGGEATLRNDFEQIVKYAKSLGLVITVLTNGLLWTSELRESLKNDIAEVQVSIDGYDETSYNNVRGFGFQRACQSVRDFLNAGYKTTIAVTPFAEDLDKHLDDYILFAKSWLEDWKDTSLTIKFSHEVLDGRGVHPTEEQNKIYKKHIEDIIEILYPGDKINTFALNRKGNSLFRNCGYGEVTVLSNGDVYFCNRVYELPKQGNVRTMSYDEIMKRAEAASKKSDISMLKPCSDCELRYICGGGCRIKHFPALVRDENPNTNSAMYARKDSCTAENKEEFYRLMIAANHLLYSYRE